MRFSNLEAELKRTGLNIETITQALGYKNKMTFYNRLNGKTNWTLADMKQMQAFINARTNQALTLDYLFKYEN